MASNRAILLLALAPLIGVSGGCSSSSADQCGGNGGKCLSCEVTQTTPIAWTQQTALGTPAQLFASFAGTCQAPFTWDASGWGSSLTVVPAQGKSTLTATVALDTASARLVTHDQTFCPDVLEIDGVATLELPEGKVADHHPFTISATAGLAPAVLGFSVDEASFGAWVSVQKSDPRSTLSMPISVSAIGRGCSGTVRLDTVVTEGNRGSGTDGPLASWSDTGCGPGQLAVDLAQPWQGIDVAAAIATSYGPATLAGLWNDGSTTTLALAASPAATVGCAETMSNGAAVLTVPADGVANSADARVRGLTGVGSVRISMNQGALWDLELGLSADLVCATQEDLLPYTSASCATASKVTAQLAAVRYPNALGTDGGTLELYVYDRQNATAGTGAAYRVDRLILAP